MTYASTVVADLTLPLPGSTTARTVLSRAIGRLLGELRAVLARGDRRDVVALGAAMDRDALGMVLRRPTVGALLRCARNDASPELVQELIATLALELSAIGALRTPIELRDPPARAISLGGRVVVDRPTQIPAADGRTPFHEITSEIVLALEDNNPLAMLEAHPRKSGNRIDLGGRAVVEWVASLRDALARIERYLPELRRELDLFVQQVVPVGYDEEAHLSASYREAIGTIYLTLHPQPMTMTEAIVHEFSHNKINALFEIDDVVRNAYEPLYKSPVRPDSRPLHGILLAVHAFVPVARLYELMIDADDPLTRHPGFRERFQQIVAGNHEGTEVLRNAEPTTTGRGVLDELARWDAHYTSAA